MGRLLKIPFYLFCLIKRKKKKESSNNELNSLFFLWLCFKKVISILKVLHLLRIWFVIICVWCCNLLLGNDNSIHFSFMGKIVSQLFPSLPINALPEFLVSTVVDWEECHHFPDPLCLVTKTWCRSQEEIWEKEKTPRLRYFTDCIIGLWIVKSGLKEEMLRISTSWRNIVISEIHLFTCILWLIVIEVIGIKLWSNVRKSSYDLCQKKWHVSAWCSP